jgi:hypothetical protein
VNYRLSILALVALLQTLAVPGIASGQSQNPACEVSDDPRFAFSPEHPVQVGGGPMYGAARQRRYLDFLRGPGGQPVTYKRTNSMMRADETVVDRYEVTYDGLEKPLTLFLDWYHFTEPRVPQGFTCDKPIVLGIPPPDPWVAREQLDALAIAQGTDKTFDATPMEIGQPVVAHVFDRYRLVARAARLAAARGSPLDAKLLSKERPRTIITAAPVSCNARTIRAKAIALQDPKGAVLKVEETATEPTALSRLIPEVQLADGTIAVVFPIETLRAGALRVSYDGPACTGAGNEVTVPLTATAGRLIESPMPAKPAGAAVKWIAIQAILDHSGSFRMPISLGGPADLAKVAMDAIATWRAEPARINGTPLATPVVLEVTFKTVE